MKFTIMTSLIGVFTLTTSIGLIAESFILTDITEISEFQSSHTVIDFDELIVPLGNCFTQLVKSQYESLGILISAKNDGSDTTHLAVLPACGPFGFNHTVPNIIGGGTSASSAGWRESVRFDFPVAASSIGAQTDSSGSNTTLTAYGNNGNVIGSVSGDQGAFMAITESNISYAIWSWNFDQGAAGFSLDNVTFSTEETEAVSIPFPPWVNISLFVILSILAARRLTS